MKMKARFAPQISICLLVSFLASTVHAQSESQKIEQAKKERTVYWYGSMSIEDAAALIEGIKRKHPFLEIRRFRGANANVMNKLDAEARGRVLSVDVVDVDGFYVAQILQRNYWTPYLSPELKAYPRELSDPKGFWAGFFLLPAVVIYNTRLVQPGEAPKSYGELLQPRWKGRIAIVDSAVPWYHGMLQYMGAEKGHAYMKRLAGQDVRVGVGNRNTVELTMAGEHPLAIGAYAHRVGQFMKKGAPMGWMKEDVLIVTPQAIGISGLGKSPNAAKLIVDFVLSPEGQAILQKSGRVPAHPNVDADPAELTKGRRLFFSDIVDGGTRFNELDAEFRKLFGVRLR